MGIAQITIELPGASHWARIPEPCRLHVGAGVEARPCRSEFFVRSHHLPVAQLVVQLDPRAQRPVAGVTALFQFDVLWTSASNQPHPAVDGMAVAQIENIDVNLAAGELRELKKLKSVDRPDLIVTPQQMAISALDGQLVAVDQSVRGVKEMSVAESARHRDRGDRTDGLHTVEYRCVREPRS